MGAKTNRRHTQGDESRERILDATIEIASQRGYQGTSIALVSKQSGQPASSIYWHFKNKDDLFAAVIQRSFERWLANTVQLAVRRPRTSVHDHFTSTLRVQAQELKQNPEFLRLGLMLALENHPEEPSARGMFLEVRERAIEAMVDSCAASLFAVHGDPNPTVARRIATFVMAATDGLFIAAQIDPDLDLGAEFNLLADIVAHLVDTAAPPSSRRAKAPTS